MHGTFTERGWGVIPCPYSTDKKVDLVMIQDEKLSLIECKAGMTVEESDASAMVKFSTAFGSGGSCIICLTERPYPLRKGVYALPLSSI